MAASISTNSHTHDIVAKLWNLSNVLKDDGVTYHQYVSELTYLLFLKMAKETGREEGIPAAAPATTCQPPPPCCTGPGNSPARICGS